MNAEFGFALQAWLLGLAVSALVVLPGMVVLDGILTEPFVETFPARVLGYFALLLPSVLMTATFGVLLSAPLFLIGLLTALTFRRQIARHPVFFAGLAPLVAVGLGAAVTVVLHEPGYSALLPALDHALRIALRGDSLIFALPVAAGSLYFCLRLSRQERSRDRNSGA